MSLFYCLIGMILMWFYNYTMSLGQSIHILKQTQQSCAALFIVSEQGLQEVLQLKYIVMKEAGRSDQNIVAQQYIDQVSIDSIRKTIMSNYSQQWPSSYSHIMEYSTWEELENYVNKITRDNKESK